MSTAKTGKDRHLGIFTLPTGQTAVGDLRIRKRSTQLEVHSEEFLHPIEFGQTIHGLAYTGEHLTLINCSSTTSGNRYGPGQKEFWFATIFPHLIATGDTHIDPDKPCVSEIHFSTEDLPTLFYDFDAFGSVIHADKIIDIVLKERQSIRPVESGPHPQIIYFTGKSQIAEVETAIGKISIDHAPGFSSGGPSGAQIKNRIFVSIKSNEATTIDAAVEKMYTVWNFLSMAAGRRQDLTNVHITAIGLESGQSTVLKLHQSYSPKLGNGGSDRVPHPAAVPLCPVRRKEEFDRVLSDWMGRHPSWRTARARYIDCLSKGNKYDVDRLIGAANMFDLLPSEATPDITELDPTMQSVKKDCISLLKSLPQSIDRDGAISALGRIGKPSLPKKALHRSSIVTAQLGEKFPDLEFAISVAIRCRNFFVHGGAGDVDFTKVEPYTHFLTDALEFVFVASDLIAAGWDSKRWSADPVGWGHTLGRFASAYPSQIEGLKAALGKS